MDLAHIKPLKPEQFDTNESNTITPQGADLSVLDLKKADSSPATFLQIVQKTVAKAKIVEAEARLDTYNFEVHGKQLRYAKNSLWFLSDQNRFRKFLVWVIESKWFTYGISVIILINTIFLALTDYEVRVNPEKKSFTNTMVNTADTVFSSIFIFEFVLKVLAMGFALEKGTYLRDGWNVIDFVVVLTSLVNNIPEVPNFSALRSIRAIKPLRSINTVKGMKALVGSLIISLPALANVAIFLSFLIVIYGILGVQLFAGAFENRCRLTPEPVNGIWLADPDFTSLCGHVSCPVGTYCGNPADYNLPKNWTEVQIPDLQYGIPNFDNMVNATLTVFQSLTTEGWSANMFLLSQTYSPFIVYTYFCSLIVFGAFFAVNLILAVISDAFSTSQTKERAERGKSFSTFQSKQYSSQKTFSLKVPNDIEDPQNTSKISSSKASTARPDEKATDDILVLLEDTPFQISTPSPQQKIPGFRAQPNKKSGFSTEKPTLATTTEKSLFDRTPRNNKHSSKVGPEEPVPAFDVDEHLNERTRNNKIYYYAHKLVLSRVFQYIIVSLILLNTIIMALAKYPDDQNMDNTIEKINSVLIFVFTTEMLLKLLGLGFREYFRDNFNIFDFMLVIVSLIEFTLDSILGSNSKMGAVLALRSFRLVRVFKLARSWTNLRNLLKIFGNTLKDIKNFSILLLLFIMISSLLGRELFAYRTLQPDGTYPRFNFNSFFEAIMTVFAVLTTENWNNIMYSFMLTCGGASAFYFVTIMVFGNYILLKLFLAILINNFQDLRISGGSANWGNVFSMMRARKKKITERLSQKARQMFAKRGSRVVPTIVPIVPEDASSRRDSVSFNASGDLRLNSKPSSPQNSVKESPFIRQISFDSKEPNSAGLGLNTSNRRGSVFGGIEPVTPSRRGTVFGMKRPVETKIELFGNSFWIFGPENKFRNLVAKMVSSSIFDNSVIFTIISSSVLLALENPLKDPSTTYNLWLTNLDRVTTGIFAFEMISKMIVTGVLLNGPQSHLRNSWSLLDSLIVVISIVTLGFDLAGGNQSVQLLKQLKILRVFRVLRPLRLVSRNEGLKLVLNSILAAIPSLVNLLFVCLLFFLLFGVVGVTFFKGQLYYCDMTNIANALQTNIITKTDCMDYGGDWVNQDENFDNVLHSMVMLFIVATTEGWEGMMFLGIDSAGVDLQPVKNNRMYAALFYMAFVVVGAFFIMNLFAGVVVDTFNREKDRLDGLSFLTKDQQAWVHMKLALVQVKPYREPDLPQNIISKKLRQITDTKKFEVVTLSMIILNMLVFALHWQRQSSELQNVLDGINYFLLGVFTFEAIIKIIGYGKNYFREGWNVFDFIIIMASILSLIVDNVIALEGVSLGSSAAIIRTFRIGRLFRLINKAKSLKTIFNTIIITLPALANIGGLLILVLFIYASLGNSLFAYQRIDENITEDTNFQTFLNSFLTLFKSSTGEGWNYLMASCSRTLAPDYACHQVNSWADYQAYGLDDCGMGWPAVIYFVSFQIIFTYILLNLFIAIILEAFNESKKLENAVVSDNDFEAFRGEFKKYDPKGRGLILDSDLDSLLQGLEPPLGDSTWKWLSKEKSKFIIQAELPVYKVRRSHDKYYQFHDILLSLCRRAVQKVQNSHVFEFEDLPESNNIVQLKQADKIKLKYVQGIGGVTVQQQVSSAEVKATSIIAAWAATLKNRKTSRKPKRSNSARSSSRTLDKKDLTLGQILDMDNSEKMIIKRESRPVIKKEPEPIKIELETPIEIEPRKHRGSLARRKFLTKVQPQDVESFEIDSKEETFPLNSPPKQNSSKEKSAFKK